MSASKWDNINLDEMEEVGSGFFETMPPKIALDFYNKLADTKNQKKGVKGFPYEASDSLSPVITAIFYGRLKNQFVPAVVEEDEWKSYWQLQYDQFPYLEAEAFLTLLKSAGIAAEEVEKETTSIL